MNVEKQINFWKSTSEADWNTAERLIISGNDYHWALFIMHLSLEKLLKGLVVKRTGDHPPKSHNLLKLAEISGLSLTDEQVALFEEANQFCLSSRYPEDEFALKQQTEPQMVAEYRGRLEEARQWLHMQF